MSDVNKPLRESSSSILYKQQRNLMIIVSIIIVGLIILYWVIDNGSYKGGKQNKRNEKNEQNGQSEQIKVETVSFAKATDDVDAKAIWMEHAQNQLKEEQEKTAEINKKIEAMEAKSSIGSDIETNPKYMALKNQVDTLAKALESSKNTTQSAQAVQGYPGQIVPFVPSSFKEGVTQNENRMNSTAANQIDNDVLNLKPFLGNELPKRNPDTYVPAGTFAEAVVLGAADASAGVNSSSKPIPMLFRIIADGTLPNHHKSHLKNCVVIGSVIGDISSERGEVNLNRISCTFPNGEIVEQQIDGNIFGGDGKNGIRGNPVWREGPLVERATGAGVLSGVSKGVAQTATTNSISALGTTQTVNSGAIFRYGATEGLSSGMDELAKYNTKRMEQYHPIIQLTAGQTVDVVFIRGFYLDGKKHEDSEQENNTIPEAFLGNEANEVNETNEANGMHSSATQTTQRLTLTEHQLEKIKQHESTLDASSNTHVGGAV